MRKRETAVWLLLSLIVFTGMFFIIGLQLGGDYGQYVDMHINREPVYPLYLACFRLLFGDHYLSIAAFIQGIFMSMAITYFLFQISRLFQLQLIYRILVYMVLLAPHVITPLFSKSHLVITNGIMSEALAMPVFLLFIIQILQYMNGVGNHKNAKALLLALLLSLIRGQMMPVILIWAAVNLAWYFRFMLLNGSLQDKKDKLFRNLIQKTVTVMVCVLLIFTARSTIVKTYNYLVHGYFINNTYGNVNFVAQVLYVADKEDGQYIKDERARHMYDVIFQKLEAEQANYSYTKGMSLIEKAYYLEEKHDLIKFDAVEPLTRQYLRDLGMDGDEYYIDQNMEIDRIAGEITGAVLPHHLDRWIGNYFAISINGLVRCIAYDKGFLMWYAFIMYIIAIGASLYLYRQNPQSKAVWFMGLSILAILANVYATSMTIMCLSRYMIYEFSVFYTALLCVGRECLERKKENVE